MKSRNNNIRAVFTIWSVPIFYKQGKGLENSQFWTGVCEERTCAGRRGITIVGDVTRKHLVID
jgi:hypothetical protein